MCRGAHGTGATLMPPAKKTPKVPRRRPLLTWRDLDVEPPTDGVASQDLAALQKKYGPPQPRDPLPGQPALPTGAQENQS